MITGRKLENRLIFKKGLSALTGHLDSEKFNRLDKRNLQRQLPNYGVQVKRVVKRPDAMAPMSARGQLNR